MDHSEINIGESMSKRKLIWISEELIIFITGFINIYSNKNGRLLKSVEIFEREVNGSSQSEKKLEQLYVSLQVHVTHLYAIVFYFLHLFL
jgi:hypothetical protein